MEKCKFATMNRDAKRCPMMQLQGFNQESIGEEMKHQKLEIYSAMAKKGMHAQLMAHNQPKTQAMGCPFFSTEVTDPQGKNLTQGYP
jgi:hypothetical protein